MSLRDIPEHERDRVRAMRERLRTVTPTVHGRSTYDNYGCRCEVCTAAKSVANAEYLYRATLARVRTR